MTKQDIHREKHEISCMFPTPVSELSCRDKDGSDLPKWRTASWTTKHCKNKPTTGNALHTTTKEQQQLTKQQLTKHLK